MDWDFGIVDVSTWTSLSAVELLDLDAADAAPSPFDDGQPQPWIELGLFITSDDGRQLSLHVQRLADFLRRREHAMYAERRHYEILPGITEVADLYVAPGDEPSVLVDAVSFGWPLVDRLLFSPPEVRQCILCPCLTDEEVSTLSLLEAGYTADDAVRYAVTTLEGMFGSPLSIGAEDAPAAAQLLRDHTFLPELADLLRAHPRAFTPEALKRLLERWDDQEPF